MVVMDPDEVARLVDFSDATRKGGVGGFVEGIVGVGRCVLGGHVLPQKIVE